MKTPCAKFSKFTSILVLGWTTLWALAGCKAISMPIGTVTKPSTPLAQAVTPTATAGLPTMPRPMVTPTAGLPTTPRPIATPTAAKTVRVAPTLPPLNKMSFTERNALYFRLLTARQAEGRDTSAAEEEYTQAIELMFAGNFTEADKKLNQAITDLLP